MVPVKEAVVTPAMADAEVDVNIVVMGIVNTVVMVAVRRHARGVVKERAPTIVQVFVGIIVTITVSVPVKEVVRGGVRTAAMASVKAIVLDLVKIVVTKPVRRDVMERANTVTRIT